MRNPLDDAPVEVVQAIRRDYEPGILSLREIVRAHSTPEFKFSYMTLDRYAIAQGWTRDMRNSIQAKAEQKNQRAIAREQRNEDTKLDQITERQVIEANAERIAQVRGEHRADIAQARKLLLIQFRKLELLCGGEGAVEKLRIVIAEASNSKELLDATKQLAAEEPILRGLMQSLRTVIEMEREAYGIDKGEAEKPPGDDSLPVDLTELARGVAFMLTRAVIAKAREQV
jgi:hypothetical protein